MINHIPVHIVQSASKQSALGLVISVSPVARLFSLALPGVVLKYVLCIESRPLLIELRLHKLSLQVSFTRMGDRCPSGMTFKTFCRTRGPADPRCHHIKLCVPKGMKISSLTLGGVNYMASTTWFADSLKRSQASALLTILFQSLQVKNKRKRPAIAQRCYSTFYLEHN